jgi:2-methylcitrate dehydratase PrpD
MVSRPAILLAERLAQFAVETRVRAPPADAMIAAQQHLLDGLAVAMAALRARSVVRPRATLALFGQHGHSSAIGQQEPRSAGAAALHNGLLMHALEFDDTHVGAVVHGAPVVLPAVLAYAEQCGSSGASVLRAVCIGWEVLVRIGAALRGALQRYGFQATSVAGPLAAAAAVAHLSGIDARRTTHALGIAGSQSSGVFEFLQDGATSKALHGGWSALGGLVAASLAADGMTGPASILEGRNGLFAAFGRDKALAAGMEESLADLGERWAVVEARPKISPCCHYIQAFLEALDAILPQAGTAADIRSIHCIVDPHQAQLICEPWSQKLAPPTGYAAKWSLPFCLAAQALRLPIDVDLFEGPLPANVLAYARRIDWSAQEDGFPERYAGRLIVMLADGRRLEGYIADVLGAPGHPFPHDALIRKFRVAAASVLSPEDVEGLLNEVTSLERSASLVSLGRYLRNAHDSMQHKALESA